MRVGPYEILGLLGSGGMGEVWRARDTRLAREVAIKVLPPQVAGDPGRRARLEREARAASSLNHPNIVTVHDIGQDGDLLYVAFERVEGRSLRAELAAGRLAPGRLADLAVQVADGLAKAHAAGVVHRDLKPENVMVTPEGVAKILDFGLARLADGNEPLATDSPTEAVLTEPGQLVGTLGYMSPEQASGQRVDHRTDQFSLGALLYELATGRRPFERGSKRQTLAAVLEAQPQPLRGERPELPPRLDRIVGRCLAKSPDERYASTRDLADELHLLRDETAGVAAPQRGGARAKTKVAAAVVALAVLAASAAFYRFGTFRAAQESRIESIAVLPLANLSKDPEQEFFADGMTEALITELAKVGSLRVISRTSIMQFKGTTKPLPEVARALGVDAVVEGSVQRAGDRVRVTAQLIRSATDHHLWADSYERDLRDVLALQGDLARAIAREVTATLSPAEEQSLTAPKAVDPRAYDTYLRGMERRYRGTEADIRASITLFETSLAADPSFAPAHAALCGAHYVLGFTGWGAIAPRQAMPLARAACREALLLDPDNGMAQSVTAGISFYYDWDLPGAEAAAKAALRSSPSDASLLQRFAWLQLNLGRSEEALAMSARARTLDPMSLGVANQHGWLLYWARRYEEAAAQFRVVLEQAPKHQLSNVMLAIVLSRQGRHEEAVVQLERGVDLSGGTSATLAQLGQVYGAAGRRAEAERLLTALEESARRGYVASYWIALVHLSLGQRDQAFGRLEAAFEQREALPLLDVEPRWDDLRSDPRFAALRQRVHAAARTGS
jgi:TolB-like protein/Tfp pilus assembly protein PilF